MKTILRILISTIFIISGLVKAIDVKGFSFKMEEYFSASVFNLPFLEKYALYFALFVVILELILGIMLLLGIRAKKTTLLLIYLCIFFAFLTFYSAYFNKVTDCGCFGDAIKFTPWQSFWKDIILLIGLIILYFTQRNNTMGPINPIQKIALSTSVIIFGYIIFIGIDSEPIIDFRDYKIGTDLRKEKKKIDKNPAIYKTFYILKNNKTGEEREVNQDDYINIEEYWAENSPWKILEEKTTSKMVKEGYKSEIAKFHLDNEQGNDETSNILNEEKVILIFSYKPKDININLSSEINKLKHKYRNINILGVSPTPNTFSSIPNLSMDATAIKTIARSNPFVLILKNGKIETKKPLKEFN